MRKPLISESQNKDPLKRRSASRKGGIRHEMERQQEPGWINVTPPLQKHDLSIY